MPKLLSEDQVAAYRDRGYHFPIDALSASEVAEFRRKLIALVRAGRSPDELAKQFEPEVVANVELKGWLAAQGAPLENQAPGSNKGGTVEAAGVKFTLTNAFHSSSSDDGAYLGEAAGIVVGLQNGTTIYFAGDTCVFGDMELIGRIYSPEVAVLPIGGHFTMDPREAGVALELLGTKRCIPCHFGTFPLLAGTPEELRRHAPGGVEIVALEPGETTTV